MRKYDHKKIERKWQREWERRGIYKTAESKKKERCYILDMFPYPSGEGLHVGHPKGYIATDTFSRFKRMNGYNVLHPMGWDAFGLPAENYALKNKTHPRSAVKKNIKRYKKQLSLLGFDYDWSREINTTDPEYYKWTQWIFVQMFKKGLAYESHEPINWCPSCKTGLANEDLEDGLCERCGSEVEQKPLRQWVLRITDYADRLLKDLENLNWPESVKDAQRNWIGRSEGAEVSFPVAGARHYVLLHGYKGSPKTNFFPWLKRELEKRGHTVEVPHLPNAENPSVEEQVNYVLSTCRFDENTVVVGHSLGSVVALKVLESLKKPVRKLVTVAGFCEPRSKDRKRPFERTFDWSFDFSKINNRANVVKILRAINDTVVDVERAKDLERNLGGNSIDFTAEDDHACGRKEPRVLKEVLDEIDVFTTRPDTIFGATYMVLAPEHPLVATTWSDVVNKKKVRDYITRSSRKTERERTTNSKKKTGVRLEGVTAINPATGEEIPVWIADYVMAHYGTGAIMAVPAHDERDLEFAREKGLPVCPVVAPQRIDPINPPKKGKPTVERTTIHALVRDPKTHSILCLNWKKHPWTTFVVGGVEDGEDIVEAARREVAEETGYTDIEFTERTIVPVEAHYYAAHKEENRTAYTYAVLFDLKSDKRKRVSREEREKHDPVWLPLEEITPERMTCAELDVWLDVLKNGVGAYTEEGVLIHSGRFTGQWNTKASNAICKKVRGEKRVSYKLRDWVFSRQRYWGEPIPLVHCQHCGVVPVPEKDLPVELPTVKNYQPTGTGESPLATISSWVNTSCPNCNAKAKRETNTMPQWAGSCWYYLRYIDPHNSKEFVSSKKEKYWMPVDVYVGGVEHATRHLIYARFWHKFLYDIKAVHTSEPFVRLKNQGLIAGPDGRKMSKRWGNIINPDDVVDRFGADTMRVYEMFMGPFEQGGPWSTQGVMGARRFLERVWRLQEKVRKSTSEEKKAKTVLHKTIKKVGEDYSTFSFNTAISSLMILVNELDSKDAISRNEFQTLLLLLAPAAPHITEELWNTVGTSGSIHTKTWPRYEQSALKEDVVDVAVQVNGKVRGVVQVSPDAKKEDVLEYAHALSGVKRHLSGAPPKKVIYVPGRIINIVS